MRGFKKKKTERGGERNKKGEIIKKKRGLFGWGVFCEREGRGRESKGSKGYFRGMGEKKKTE